MSPSYADTTGPSLEDLGRALLRRELEVAGDERLSYQGRLPVFVRAARAAGLSMVEVARTTGLSRKAAYDALARTDSARAEDVPGLGRALIGLLASRGAMSVQMVDSVLGAGPRRVSAELEGLVAEGAAHRLHGDSGSRRVTYYVLNEDAAATAIARRLEDIRGVRVDSFSVYFALAPDEIERVQTAAHEVISPSECTVIPLRNNSAAATDELAIAVRGPDRRIALETAEQLWEDIAHRAGIARAARITQIIDPVRDD
jgi:hypothetical protein